ncbi:hypothetical protein MTO96_045131 [Rhipicephalus appendiculatus]
MQVEVEEEEIRTEEFQEGSGWTHVVRKAKIQGKETTRPPTPERQSRPRERDKYAKKVIASTTRASKMPNVLPREDIKIVVRPRGGLNIAKRQATVATAIRAASGDIKGRRQGRHVLPKCTPEHRGDSMVKGIIRGVPVEDTPAEIHRNIVHPRNPLARRARRIGNTTTAIAAFEGLKVPNYVCYETVLLRCSLYRKHWTCAGSVVGSDIGGTYAPIPVLKCFDCGANNPAEGHDCKAKCRICGGPHPTGDRDCKHRNKVPYVVTRRQWERKTEEQRARRQLADPDEFPKLGTTAERAAAAATERSTSRSRKNSRDRSASKRRSASRQCGRSKPGERVGWTDAVKAGIRKREPSLQQSLVPSGGSNSGDKKTDKRDEEMELLKKNVVMLTRANEVLKRKIAELVAALDMSNKEVMALKMGGGAAMRAATTAAAAPTGGAGTDLGPGSPAGYEGGDCGRRDDGGGSGTGAQEEGVRRTGTKPTTPPTASMDRAATSATAVGTTRGLLVWQWHCNGFARKKAVLQQHLEQTTVRPDVIVLQETLTEEVKFPGYKASVSSPSLRDTTGSTGRGACTLVRKGITFLEHKVLGENSLIEHTFIENTGHELGSDHYIVEIAVPLSSGGTVAKSSNGVRTHKVTDWDAFRGSLPAEKVVIEDIEEWTAGLTERAAAATREIETDASFERVDNRLAHLIEAKQALLARWKVQRTNRKLRKKIAELNRMTEAHCRTLCAQRWHEICSAADGQMHCGRAWTVLRHLLDETKTKSYQRDRLNRIMHAEVTECGEEEVRRRLDAKYLPATPEVHHPDYQGRDAHIEDTLQAAVDAIEEQLDGSGLVCSPSKSELLVVPPKGVRKKERDPRRDREKITIRTSGGQVIPHVEKIRVLRNLGMEPRRADEETAEGAEVPECVRRHVQVRPIPNNVNPEYNRERRAARARALIDLHARDSGAVYVDAAEYKDRRGSFRRGSGQRGHQRDKGGGERAGTSSASGRGGSHRPGSRRPRMHDRAE